MVKKTRHLSVWRVLGVFVVMIIVTALLGAGALHSEAEDISSKPLRGLAVAATTPVFKLSEFLRLDRPLKWVNASDQGEQDATADENSSATATSSSNPGTSATTSTAPQATVTTAKPKVFDSTRPLKVLLVGDSMMLQVGDGMTRASDPYPGLKVKFISKPATGLVSSQRYDWPPNFKVAVAQYQPDVTVMLFGGNEKITMQSGDDRLIALTPDWTAEYKRRLNAFFDTSTEAGARVIWIGMPIMRSPKFSQTCRSLNAIYSSVCTEHGNATFLETYSLFSDSTGKYSAYLKDSKGGNKLMRAKDGIHFTEAGGDRVASAILNVLRRYYQFE